MILIVNRIVTQVRVQASHILRNPASACMCAVPNMAVLCRDFQVLCSRVV